MKPTHCLLALFAFSLAPVLTAQQAVPPPPKPADNGPTLAATSQFLLDKLSDIGTVSFVVLSHDTVQGNDFSNSFTNTISKVVVDPGACRISYHWKTTRDGAGLQEIDAAITLHDVEDVVVKPFEQYQNEINAAANVPNLIAQSSNPPLSALVVRRPHGISNLFPFTDAALADRIAKALTHAVELCGGGNKDPF